MGEALLVRKGGGAKGIPVSEFLGMTKFAVDEIAVTSDTQIYTVTFNHSLGDVPKIVMIFAENANFQLAAGSYEGYILQYEYVAATIRETVASDDCVQFSCYIYGAKEVPSYVASQAYKPTIITDTQFCIGNSKPTSAKIKAGTKYKIITMA
ncbi:unknown [Firmicutes bacterium CAG:238]|nr:unknown [Firmicutes bacterium CAG:238]